MGIRLPVTIDKLWNWIKVMAETKTDMGKINAYVTFRDLGKDSLEPVVHKKIWVCLVYDLNYYGHHKARLLDY